MSDVRIQVAEFSDFEMLLTDFVSQLGSYLDRIPPEYRTIAIIEFDHQGAWEDSGKLEISYTRPLTDEEVRQRDEWDRHYRSRLEAQERKQLAELKAKYE